MHLLFVKSIWEANGGGATSLPGPEIGACGGALGSIGR